MASRYWVGGNGSWTGASTANWAATSGGASGASVPTSGDDVFFDASSGSCTCQVAAGSGQPVCKSIDFTGSSITTFSFVDAGVTVSGNVTLNASVSYTGTQLLTIDATSAFAGNSVSLPWRVTISGGTTTLQSALTVTHTSGLTVSSGAALATNGQALTVVVLTISNTATLTCGASTITVTGTGTCVSVNSGATVTAGTSTFKLTNSSASTKTFAGGGKTFYDLWIATGSSGTTTISGSNTFHDIKLTNTAAATLFTAGTTQTATSLTWAGTAGNLITVRSTSNGSAWSISIATGTITVDFCSIRDSTATGGAMFLATNSTNVSGNSGWIFGAAGLFGFGRILPL